MSDENTTDLPASNTSDLPPEAVEATPSVTKNAGKSSFTRKIYSASKSAGKHPECRSEPRIHVRWHAKALIDGHSAYNGFVKDISLKGADIFLGHSLQKVKFVNLHIHVPPLSVTSDPRIVEVSGKIIYTAYDSNESLFHTGINFLQFNLESDLAYLRSRIANY